MHRAVAVIFLATALIAMLACVLGGVAWPAQQTLALAPAPAEPNGGLPMQASVVEPTRAHVAGAAMPVVVNARALVRDVLPANRPPAVAVDPAAVDLIVRWEVSGEAQYRQRLQHPIWPGGASGITWGIGYDAGHKTKSDISASWSAHGAVERLTGAAGLAGTQARDQLPGFADIVVPWPLAHGVFVSDSLPAYLARARRAFGPPFEGLPPRAQGALVSLVYNRGPSMAGTRNREKRAIRDLCLPAADLACIADELRAMCRIWAGTPAGPGLCRRRHDEARLVGGTT